MRAFLLIKEKNMRGTVSKRLRKLAEARTVGFEYREYVSRKVKIVNRPTGKLTQAGIPIIETVESFITHLVVYCTRKAKKDLKKHFKKLSSKGIKPSLAI
jgi:hypothetical protein